MWLIALATLVGVHALTAPVHALSSASASFVVREARITPVGSRQSGPQFAVPCAGILPAQGRSSSASFVLQAGCAALQGALLDAPVVNEPPEFAVRPNTPNPFSNSMRLEYRLPGKAAATVEIFDTLGRLILKSRQGEQRPGWHVFTWDGRDAMGRVAPPGLYILRFAAGEHTLTRRVVKLR